MNIQIVYNKTSEKITIRNLVGTNTVEYDKIKNLEDIIEVIQEYLKDNY